MMSAFFNRKEKIINRALSCKGWTNYNRLSLLYDFVKRTRGIKGDILEIGSAFGRSTVLLALSSKKMIWSIDPHTGGRVYIEKNENQNSLEEFKANLQRFNIKNVKILEYTTQEVIDMKLIPDEVGFSFIFIDGLHTPEGVTIDFELSYKLIQTGGIVALDDYFWEGFKDYADTIDIIAERMGITLHKDPVNKMVFFEKA